MAGTSAAHRDTDFDIPGGSLVALRDFIVTLPSEPAEQLTLIEQVLRGASPAIRDPVTQLVRRLVVELPLICPEEEFHALMDGRGYESRVPFHLSEEIALPTYSIYRELMECGPVPFCELSVAELHRIALHLKCAHQSRDGRITCPRATLECLYNFIHYIVIPVQEVFVNQKAYAYMFGAVLYRMGMRLEGTAPSFTLRAVRPVDVELRDQHAYLALQYTDEDLLYYQVSPSTIRQLRRQACYIFKDHCVDVLARMELHRSRYLTAVRGHENEHATAYLFDAIQLDTLAYSHGPIDVEINADHHVRERESILLARMNFEPVRSLVNPQVISMFWRLLDIFLPLSQAIRNVMPLWLVANKDYVAFQEAQIDMCIKNLALLKEQDLSRNGIRQLTGTPLYILTFDALLDVIKAVHKLHRLLSKDLKLPAPLELCEVGAWPTAEWLARQGFNRELGKIEHDQR
ncbi:hypothetical protein CALCODRAFT_509136 [Calocera cornea HHB12733]|uniref:Uncharacterized protein n=1 Tax=Calocera cornea HHB12733 TaxID=1353952 RepID=A0A165FLZ7_9BASI|nr:hypothetical protein CALCODRAFT_509136 [Calocera cornea HHB12733]